MLLAGARCRGERLGESGVAAAFLVGGPLRSHKRRGHLFGLGGEQHLAGDNLLVGFFQFTIDRFDRTCGMFLLGLENPQGTDRHQFFLHDGQFRLRGSKACGA